YLGGGAQMNESNPWVAASMRNALPDAPLPEQPGQRSEPTGAPVLTAHPPVTGAAGPQSAIDFPTAGALPTHEARRVASLWAVGAHGGAGETSLASLNP